MKRHFYIKN